MKNTVYLIQFCKFLNIALKSRKIPVKKIPKINITNNLISILLIRSKTIFPPQEKYNIFKRSSYTHYTALIS